MISIRKSNIDDANFISTLIFSAIGFENPKKEAVEKMTEVCQMSDVLYSYQNVYVAEFDGERAGIVLSYDGAKYAEWRTKTFAILKNTMGVDFANMVDETRAGEWYVDSLAVSPTFRKKGIARQLLNFVIEKAKQNKFAYVTLAVDAQNLPAWNLYKSLGFKETGILHIFDYDYERMELEI